MAEVGVDVWAVGEDGPEIAEGVGDGVAACKDEVGERAVLESGRRHVR